MADIILKKWIEPYVLLETLKKHYDMKDFTFDGWTKNSVKEKFLQSLSKPDTVGLYMKNVNKFYVFSGCKKLNITELFNLAESDIALGDNPENALTLVDLGKSEASFINV